MSAIVRQISDFVNYLDRRHANAADKFRKNSQGRDRSRGNAGILTAAVKNNSQEHPAETVNDSQEQAAAGLLWGNRRQDILSDLGNFSGRLSRLRAECKEGRRAA
jgi:hypothetical protein